MVCFIEGKVGKVDIFNHPSGTYHRSDRTKDELRNENHDDLSVRYFHQSRGFVPSLCIVLLYFGIMSSVYDTANDIFGILE